MSGFQTDPELNAMMRRHQREDTVPVTYAAKATAGLMERHSAALERIAVLERALERIWVNADNRAKLPECKNAISAEFVATLAREALDGETLDG